MSLLIQKIQILLLLLLLGKMQGKKLNLGCGAKKLEGFVNIDFNNIFKPDVVHDLNKQLPFSDDSVSEIRVEHVLSYLDDINRFFKDIYRVCKNDAKIMIAVPHFSYGFVDPNHKRGFSYGFLNFVQDYTKTRFKINSIRFRWLRQPEKYPLMLRLVGPVVNLFANLHKGLCERVWCYWVGGFEEVFFELRVIK